MSFQRGNVAHAERERAFGHPALTVWLTGLSGAGKTTIAFGLEKRLFDMGVAVYVLDGDNMRHGLSRDLDFSPLGRRENIRRVAEVSQLMNDAGLVAITAFISPYCEDRENARTVIGTDRFVEVFVDAPLSVCEARDPKQLYQRARKGLVPDFTGVSAPYEAPERPAVHLHTDRVSADEAVEQVLSHLSSREIGRPARGPLRSAAWRSEDHERGS